MTLDSVRSLLEAKPDDVAGAEFAGAWDLFSFRNDLLESPEELRARGVAYARTLTEALKKRFPFDYVQAYSKPGEGRTDALGRAFGGAPNVSPTPFLPAVVFVSAVDGAANELTEGTSSRCSQVTA
jgi:hypothetical protein